MRCFEPGEEAGREFMRVPEGGPVDGGGLQLWIMRLLHRYTTVNYKRFQEMGIHPGQLPFLRIISEEEGISQGDLARRLHVKPPTVAMTVKRLERSEIICRRPDQSDLRVSRIFLTEKGRELSARIVAVVEENERMLTDGFSEEELDRLKEYFTRMTKNLEKG